MRVSYINVVYSFQYHLLQSEVMSLRMVAHCVLQKVTQSDVA